tara:strand:- start:8255 stop:8413 length:159 start_codon:yes stop_codon:yes gene_type:complete
MLPTFAGESLFGLRSPMNISIVNLNFILKNSVRKHHFWLLGELFVELIRRGK